MASIHRVLSRALRTVQFWDLVELDSEQPATLLTASWPSQRFTPYVC